MKVTCRRLFVAVVLATIGLDSYAAGCDQAQTQAEMNQCAAEALNQADSDLNATYLAYREKLNTQQKNQLRDVQLAWIKYRDLACKFDSVSSTGGSLHSMALQSCLAEKTRSRTLELNKLANCAQGDSSCPH